MRTLVTAAFLLSACGSSSSAPAPTTTAPPPPTTIAAPATTVAPPPTHAPIPTATPSVSAATAHAVAAAVREGRREAHAGHLPAASAAFDRALALVPGQPRVLCEAGFIAHRAGDDTLAAHRIESALHAFGPPEHVSAAFREPLAMCLYNRGVVAEAHHDLQDADAAYEGSIALRPNATVSAAYARAHAALLATQGEQDSSHVSGVAIDDDVVHATTAEALLGVLRVGMRGDDGDGDPVAAADVVVRETFHRPTSGTELLLLDVDSRDEAYPQQRLVIAERVADGYRIGAIQVGAQDLMMSESQGDSHLLDVTSRWEGDALIVEASYWTNEGSFDSDGDCTVEVAQSLSDEVAIVCAPGQSCVAVPIEHEDTGATTSRHCDSSDDDSSDDDSSDDDSQTDADAASSSVEVHVEGDAIVVEGNDPDASLISPGRHPFADLDTNVLEVPDLGLDAT